MATDLTTTPIALTIAGSDPSGGAGIQADLKTFTALGVYGAAVLTSLTAQNTRGVSGIHVVPPGFVKAQIDAVASDLTITATKTGMLGDRATVLAVVAGIKSHNIGPLIVDPVMVATSGDALIAADAIDAVRRDLIPLAELITPNLSEAARLLDTLPADNEAAMQEQARRLLALGARGVLLKGGHGQGASSVDILAYGGEIIPIALPRLDVPDTHGTGCTLSAAIAALLAGGSSMVDAVRQAKQFVWDAINAGQNLRVGHGSKPVDHLHATRPKPVKS